MMGGGGSMQNMQNVLKNNRSLLKGRRRSYFKRELSYRELRAYYKESTTQLPEGKKAQKKLLNEIRSRLIKRKRRVTVLLWLLALTVTASISITGYTFLNNKSFAHEKTMRKKKMVPYRIEQTTYEKNMLLGRQNLEYKEYFMAMGNYQKALGDKSGDLWAEFGLAKALAKSCRYKRQFCEEAIAFIDSMENKYPNQVSFTKLKRLYLESK